MTIASSFPGPPSRTGLRLREKKSLTHVEGPYLDAAVADFSGYLAVDELYDGPFCILLAVDPRQQRRLMYEVLDHDPARLDIFLFLLRLNEELRNRGKTVEGITTDGSSLYPVPIPLVFGSIRHQVCRFHIIKEVIQAINKVLSGIRKELHAQIPKLPSGRSKNTPRNQEKKQRVQALKQHVSELFKHRKLRTPDIPTKSWAFSPSWPEQCDESSERLLGVLTSTTHSCAAAVSLSATSAGGDKTAHASWNLCQEF